ncbi:MAG: type II secretion system F family protein [Candidatus Aminicenantes bacterium]|nr:type II secretion system F family protein [Candidatus Aminicenantes bacterium]
MPYYNCRVAAETGEVFSETFLAPTSEACCRHFRERGFCILSVKRDWKKIRIAVFPHEKRLKDNEFIMFNQELVALLKAGYPVLKCIEIVTGRIRDIRLKEVLMEVEEKVKSGSSLSEAFSQHSRYFPTVYIASIMAGEKGGNLPETIKRYIGYKKVLSQAKERIKTALMYPTVLVVFSFVLILLLVNFIIPRFSDFYSGFGAKLPVITQALLSFSMTMQRIFPLILILLLLMVAAFLRIKKNERALVGIDKLKLHLPYGGVIWRESSISQFCRTLGLLLSGGISLLSSIDIARRSVPNHYIFHRMRNIQDDIKNGENISKSLERTECFSSLALDMIKVGETSANLEGMLFDTADVYDQRVQAKVDRFVSLVEPIIIVLMGLVVAGMLLSVYLPIFNIIRVAG